MSTLVLLLLLLYSVLHLKAASSSRVIARPGCLQICGNVSIPYPFGIGTNCFHDEFYEIICNTSFSLPKPFLHKFNLEVMDIRWNSRFHLSSDEMEQKQLILVGTAHRDTDTCRSKVSIDFRGSPYFFSRHNVVVMDGYGGSVVLKNRGRNILTGCATIRRNDTAYIIAEKDCYGVGCCHALLPENLEFYQLDINLEAANSSACDMKVGLIDRRLVNKFAKSTVATILEWRAPASYVKANMAVHHNNFSCHHSGICFCSSIYQGNPYLPNGCKVMRECRKCRHFCTSTFDQAGQFRRYHCGKNPLLKRGSVLGFSLGMGLMVLLLGCYFLYKVVQRKKWVRRKSEYFKRNGGLLLQQQLSSGEDVAQDMKVFPVAELEKATDNFDKNRILGLGRQGTVYKGMLKDGRIVAIKKSRVVDENLLEEFINEVVILSKTNHRNVVKLLGCCLETEVPMLVYEFIQNGTLYQHIHHASEDFHVTWTMRLQMAAESADAVAYLHSSTSAPIYHRDIKSSNILLDSKFRAKVSDFGISKAIEIEQTHVTTCVMGTYGYLDPEYFQSNQFTDKSDVYSFGVVLVELITGKKPICPSKDGEWINLAVEFLMHMENDQLSDILDAQLLDEGREEEFVAVANLARQCLNMNGKERPTMKEIATVLEEIRASHVPCETKLNSRVGKGVATEMKHDGASSSNAGNSDPWYFFLY